MKQGSVSSNQDYKQNGKVSSFDDVDNEVDGILSVGDDQNIEKDNSARATPKKNSESEFMNFKGIASSNNLKLEESQAKFQPKSNKNSGIQLLDLL